MVVLSVRSSILASELRQRNVNRVDAGPQPTTIDGETIATHTSTPTMDQQFRGLGIRFRYPDDWQLSEELGDDEVSITVTSPESAFWSATVMRLRPDPEDVLQMAIDVFRDEYDELDVAAGEARIAHRQVSSADIDFVCLEMTNTAHLRAFRTGMFTVLVLYQRSDADREDQDDTLQAISDSLMCEADIDLSP